MLYGAVEMRGAGGLQLTNPQYEILDDEDGETIHTGRIVPVYEKTGSVTPKMQRRLVYDALQRLPADLPDHAARRRSALRLELPSRYARARWRRIFRRTDAPIDALNRFATPAQRRLIFEEAFLFQMGVLARRQTAAAEAEAGGRSASTIASASRRGAVLPFRLTPGQKQALKEIVDDLQRPQPMNRLLQGDVGAGKTIVALLAALVAMENGLQVAFMAPTEILAEQHFVNISRLLQASRFRVALLTGVDRRAPRGASSSREIEVGRDPPGRRHARAGAGRRAVQAARAGGHRRAASVRRAAARDAARQGAASRRAGDDGDADSAHAGADGLRRSRRVDDPRSAAGPPADQDRSRSRSRGATRSTSSCAAQLDAGPAGLRRSIRWSRSPRRSI